MAKGKKSAKAGKVKMTAAQAILSESSIEDIRAGITFGLMFLRPLAKRSKNKKDDAAVAFAERLIEPGNLEKVAEVLDIVLGGEGDTEDEEE